MKSKFPAVLLAFTFVLATAAIVRATCRDTANQRFPYESDTKSCEQFAITTITKTLYWNIYWLDSNIPRQIDIRDYGQSTSNYSAGCHECWPEFDSYYWTDDGTTAYWYQKTFRATSAGGDLCSLHFTDDHRQGHTCRTAGACLAEVQDWFSYPSSGCITGLFFGGPCTRSSEFRSRCADPTGYEEESCSCPDGTTMSPIIVDVDNSGFSMTDALRGVVFNMLNDGVPLQISWTAPDSTNAFLALDRNGNGTIDNGQELFGDLTPQPLVAEQNGFLALAEYDKTQNGGNGNARVDQGDGIFSALRLWQDANHNGISESSELHTLPSLSVDSVSVDFKESKKTDEYGNKFRYRSKVDDAKHGQVGHWAWDVFLLVN